MPLTEETLTYEEMKAIIANPQNKCADCGGNLSIAWGGAHGYDTHILRCSVNIDHAGYVKEKTQAMFPGSHVGAIPVKEYKEMEKELGTMTRGTSWHRHRVGCIGNLTKPKVALPGARQ